MSLIGYILKLADIAERHPVEKSLRKLLKEIQDRARKQDLSIFAVATDNKGKGGASIYSAPKRNKHNEAVKRARKHHIAWEKEHGLDPKHDWGKEASKRSSSKGEDVVAGGSQAAAGVGLMAYPGVRSRVLGYKRLYHGTYHDKAVQSIREKGLKPTFGGTGASKAHPMFLSSSMGKVHVTSNPLYALLFTASPDALQKTMAGEKVLRQLFPETSRKRILKLDVPYREYHKAFKYDPDFTGRLKRNASVLQERLKRNQAAITEKPISSEYIHKGKGRTARSVFLSRMKNLPGYIWRHPGRFGLGLAGMGTGAYMAATGLKRALKSDKKEENKSTGIPSGAQKKNIGK